MKLVLFCTVAYLIGSVNFSILVNLLAGRGDVRNYFSRNPGAVNTYRVLGKWWALLVLALDLGRGLATSLLGDSILPSLWQFCIGCLAVLVGNLFPVFHRFRGGKGMATTLGLYLAIDPVSTLVVMVIWLAVVYGFGRASLGSLSAMSVYPILLALRGKDGILVGFSIFILLVIVFTHRKNIRRLLSGEEPVL